MRHRRFSLLALLISAALAAGAADGPTITLAQPTLPVLPAPSSVVDFAASVAATCPADETPSALWLALADTDIRLTPPFGEATLAVPASQLDGLDPMLHCAGADEATLMVEHAFTAHLTLRCELPATDSKGDTGDVRDYAASAPVAVRLDCAALSPAADAPPEN
ncbi:MAG: hypothetical protein AAGF46_01480 [Pseudomonadota bacterium]